jgi:hypothetical protein
LRSRGHSVYDVARRESLLTFAAHAVGAARLPTSGLLTDDKLAVPKTQSTG